MSGIQKTHFADDATLARISQLERELAEALAEAQREKNRADVLDMTAQQSDRGYQFERERAEQAERRAAELERDALKWRLIDAAFCAIGNKTIKTSPFEWAKLKTELSHRIDAALESEKGDSHE